MLYVHPFASDLVAVFGASRRSTELQRVVRQRNKKMLMEIYRTNAVLLANVN